MCPGHRCEVYLLRSLHQAMRLYGAEIQHHHPRFAPPKRLRNIASQNRFDLPLDSLRHVRFEKLDCMRCFVTAVLFSHSIASPTALNNFEH